MLPVGFRRMVFSNQWREHFPLDSMEIDLKIRLIGLVLEYRRLLKKVVVTGNVIQLFPNNAEIAAVEYSIEKIHNEFHGSEPSITDRKYTKNRIRRIKEAL